MSESPSPVTIRSAAPADVPALHSLIVELAVFEKLEHEVLATEASTHAALFGPSPSAEALIAQAADSIVGFALFYPFYSTFAGRSGLYLEDLYVQPAHRRHGLGRALVNAFIHLARQRHAPKIEWRVLTWNHGAIQFYQSLGATILHDWVPVRLTLSDQNNSLPDRPSGLKNPSQPWMPSETASEN